MPNTIETCNATKCRVSVVRTRPELAELEMDAPVIAIDNGCGHTYVLQGTPAALRRLGESVTRLAGWLATQFGEGGERFNLPPRYEVRMRRTRGGYAMRWDVYDTEWAETWDTFDTEAQADAEAARLSSLVGNSPAMSGE